MAKSAYKKGMKETYARAERRPIIKMRQSLKRNKSETDRYKGKSVMSIKSKVV
jgi:hypothetical protein